MSNMITRCPKCATSFRITSAQLQSAKGAVRCGSCLHIFKAQDHLISSEAPAAPAKPAAANRTAPAAERSAAVKPPVAAAPQAAKAPIQQPPQATQKIAASTPVKTSIAAQSTTPAKTAAKSAIPNKSAIAVAKPLIAPIAPVKAANATPPRTTKSDTDSLLFNQAEIDREIADFGDDDDILISDDMDQLEQEPDSKYLDGFLDIEPTPKQSSSLFERNQHSNKEKDEDDADESWAMSLLDESDEDNKFAAIKRDQHEQEHPVSDDDEYEHHSDEYLDVMDDASADDYHTSHARDAENSNNKHSNLFSLVSDTPDFKEIFTEDELSEEMHASRSSGTHARDHHTDDAPPVRAYDTSRAALLMNIMPEPVIMTRRRKRSWYQRKLWLLLALLMIIILAIQIAWLQFNHLSRIEPYRTGYAFICPLLGCTLPVLIDRDLIRVRNLVVRKHPTTENALIVDVILINTAPFKQPFPDLVMAFSDIDEKPVAGRRFTPREYLAGELAGLNMIPQNQPVHISLELVDPGEAAVNYKIEPY